MLDDIDKRVRAVERLTRLFRAERFVYLSVTFLSLALLLTAAALMIREKQAGSVELTLMFGSSGLVTYTAGRLLSMWNQAMKLIVPAGEGKENAP